LPNGTIGATYLQTFSASGSTAPYTYAVTAGSLPAGLSLGSGGALSGAPGAAGSYSFTVTATDAHGFSISAPYSLAIDVALTTTTLTLSPNPVVVSHTVIASVTVASSGALPSEARAPIASTARAGVLAAVPTGTLSVSGGGQSCTVSLVNGNGSCALTYSTIGTFAIVATYSGDAQNLGSTTNGTLVVAAPAPVTPEPSPTLSGLAQTLLGLALIFFAERWRRGVDPR
jgi:large repetitive protein